MISRGEEFKTYKEVHHSVEFQQPNSLSHPKLVDR